MQHEQNTTSKPKHTPGPWRAQPTAGHGKHGQSVVYAECDGRDVAIVYDGAADANLIAVAPVLLAAVRLFLKCHDQDRDYSDMNWDFVRDALSEVEG